MADSKKKNTLGIALCALILLAIAISFSGAAYARYNKTSVCSVIYGESSEEKSTLSEEGKIYDFGVWRSGSANALTHTLVLQDSEALRGKLTFSWDAETAEAGDVALEAGIAERTVSEDNGAYSMPIVLHTTSTRSAVATLDIKWTPESAHEAPLTARYRVALNPEVSVSQPPVFGSATDFISKELLLLEASIRGEFDDYPEFYNATGNFDCNFYDPDTGAVTGAQTAFRNKKATGVLTTKIILDDEDIWLKAGENKKLLITVEPDDATNKAINWNSLNSKIARIDPETGIIYGINPGTTILFGISDDKRSRVNVKVTVE